MTGVMPDRILRCGFCGRLTTYRNSHPNYFVGRICDECYVTKDEYGETRRFAFLRLLVWKLKRWMWNERV